jgi:cell division septal protein FtsQ
VKVISYKPEVTTTTVKIEEKPISIEKITGMLTKTFLNVRIIFIALLVIAILFVLWIIYKHG